MRLKREPDSHGPRSPNTCCIHTQLNPPPHACMHACWLNSMYLQAHTQHTYNKHTFLQRVAPPMQLQRQPKADRQAGRCVHLPNNGGCCHLAVLVQHTHTINHKIPHWNVKREGRVYTPLGTAEVWHRLQHQFVQYIHKHTYTQYRYTAAATHSEDKGAYMQKAAGKDTCGRAQEKTAWGRTDERK